MNFIKENALAKFYNSKYCLCPLNMNEWFLSEYKLHISQNQLMDSAGAFLLKSCSLKFHTFCEQKIFSYIFFEKVIMTWWCNYDTITNFAMLIQLRHAFKSSLIFRG